MDLTTLSVITASWWEPNSAGVFDIGDLATFLAFFVALTGVLMGVSRWWMKVLRGIIKEEIETATKPIQPGANGGLSLADVARKTDKLETQIADIASAQSETKDLLIEFLAQSVIIPDEAPVAAPRSRAKKTAS